MPLPPVILEAPADVAPASSVPPASTASTASTASASASTRRWYGYETLLVDGAALAMMIGGGVVTARAAASDGVTLLPSAVAGVGGITYLFGGPVVHWAHGRVGTGFLDLGLRVALPLVGLGIGALVPGVLGRDNTAGALVGAAVGAGGAIAVDAAFLGFERVPVRSDAPSARVLTLRGSFF